MWQMDIFGVDPKVTKEKKIKKPLDQTFQGSTLFFFFKEEDR
jgi:hypothetical protein